MTSPTLTRRASAAAALLLALGVAACGGDDDASSVAARPLDLTILHVNDHHSRLDAETINLSVRTAAGSKEVVQFPLGGFARVAQAIDELSAGRANALKLHAGDAVTGDLYYTITDGRADAELMNTVCFDAFTLGNHEFDSGDAGLKTFLDFLRAQPGSSCRTPVLSANTNLVVGASPLAVTGDNDYIRPWTVVDRDGQRIGIVGITVAGKTKNSSRPDASTTFAPEVATAQRVIDELRATGIDKIVLLTHQGYSEDQAMARALSGVDVIVGGDSHTLLGAAELTGFGVSAPAGPYPTQARDRDGKLVCIVQAWQYSWAVGELRVRFSAAGHVESCDGRASILLGNANRRVAAGAAALTDADRSAIGADLATQPTLRITGEAPRAVAALAGFAQQKVAFGATVGGSTATNLCLRRVPGTKRDITRSKFSECNSGAFTSAHGGDMQQIVARAFLEQGRSFGGVDASLQNGGGVRIDLDAGNVTVGNVYTVLPFRNVLVRLTMTGAEIKQTLEDAVTFLLAAPGNTGTYPYAANLRWRVDLNQPANARISALEIKSAAGTWGPVDPAASYRIITNDFVADGGDGWVTLRTITGSRRENTFLDYADSFLRYTRANSPLARPAQSEFSTQQFTDTP
ncbi:MAG: 5'-nucleotidase C-terminal domain-containing protein [Burkholderiaceae bacterium]|jgi:5'-nucleotidase|nr:5'-nucleotidase C-terminal domain-containing protein [Burkholderiaceae bacterium]